MLNMQTIKYTQILCDYLCDYFDCIAIKKMPCFIGLNNVSNTTSLQYDLFGMIDKILVKNNMRTQYYELINAYIEWHKLVCIVLFGGIPNDKIHCKKCIIFARKCVEILNGEISNEKIILNNFNKLTSEKCAFNIYNSDIITISDMKKHINKSIPCVHISDTDYINQINKLRDFIRSLYDIKILFPKSEYLELKATEEVYYSSLSNIDNPNDPNDSNESNINDDDYNNNDIILNDIYNSNNFSEIYNNANSKTKNSRNGPSGKNGSSGKNGKYVDSDSLESIKNVDTSINISEILGHYISHIYTTALMEVDYGYALTVHKSQGSTYGSVYCELDDINKNRKLKERERLIYTALTRTSEKLYIYINQ